MWFFSPSGGLLVTLQFTNQADQAFGDVRAGIDRDPKGDPRLKNCIETVLLLSEPEENLFRRIDIAIFNGSHHVERILSRELKHRSDVVHKLQVEPLGVGPNALAMHAELQRRGSLSPFTGKDARVALEAAEYLGEPKAARLKITQCGGRLALRSCPRGDFSLARPIDRRDGRNGPERRKRRQDRRERIRRHARIGVVSIF